MPVVMVKVDKKALKTQPSWQVDLNKIYTEFYKESSLVDSADFISQSLAKPNHWFAGALFNDHLLGAVLVAEQAASWQLECLQVRKVTQRRGVAKRLMDLLITEAKEKGKALYLPDLQNYQAAEALVTELGFLPLTTASSANQGWVLKSG